jgi:DNA-binding SARP family transcriptional activator/tetratricopeptide (TPR) repeat protein
MRFRVLGPVEVLAGGRALELGGQKPRALLALLIAANGRTVSVDRLIEDVWSGAPPPEAMASLQTYVARLRRVLEPGRSARAPARLLVTRSPGYFLAAEPGQVDARDFEELVQTAQRLLPSDPAGAVHRLDSALDLWYGTAYQDVADACPDLAVEATRLEELRLVATEDRWDASLRLGGHTRLVGELESMVVAHPTRERSWGLLALALYRSQRQADALAALRRAREQLAGELGLDPGPELRRLEEQLLRQDPALAILTPAGAAVSVPSSAQTSTSTSGSPSLPAAPRRPRPPGSLIGRVDELERLDGVLRKTRGGIGRIVVVTGEAGIGKTRIAEAAQAAAEALGFRTGWGRCEEEGSLHPLWPWTQALRDVLGRTAADPDTAYDIGGRRDDLAPLFPELSAQADADGVADADSAAFRLADAAGALLSRLASAAPVLIVFDDLQWADADSLHLLRRLAPTIRSWPVVLLVTVRDTEAGIGPALSATLAALARLDPVRLRPSRLDVHAVTAYLREHHHTDVTDETAKAVHHRTEGNPFYLVELARLLHDEGRLDDPSAAAALNVPHGVRDVVRRRLAQLPEPVAALLRTAAVVGQEFAYDLAAAAAEIDSDTALEALESALLAGLIVADGPASERYHFAHALVRDAIYEHTSVPQRTRQHLRVARAIEQLYAGRLDRHAAELAHHYGRAGPGQAGPTWRYAVRAAELAEQLPAYEEAARLYAVAAAAAAADPAVTPAERDDLFGRLGRAYVRIGDIHAGWEALETAANAALADGDPTSAARAAVAISVDSLWNWRAYNETDPHAIVLFDRLAGEVPSSEPVVLGQTRLALAIELYYQPDDSRGPELAEAGLALIRRHGTARELQHALRVFVAVHQLPGKLEQRLVASRELVELAESARSDPLELARAYCLRGCTQFERGQTAEALADLARARTWAMEERIVPLLVVLGWAEVLSVLAAGRFAMAERTIDRVSALHATTTLAGATELPAVHLFCLRLAQGRLAELEPELRAFATASGITSVRDMHALSLVMAGGIDEARRSLGPWHDQQPLPDDFFWLPSIAIRAELWSRLGSTAATEDLRAQLEPYADRMAFGGTGVALLGRVSHPLGLLARTAGDHDHAVDLLRDAMERHEADGFVPFAARSAAELARTLRARGRRTDLREADRVAARYGQGPD